MLHILFLSGTFGSTIFYVVNKFVAEDQMVDFPDDPFYLYGSMHNFEKAGHWRTREEYENFFTKRNSYNITVSTPVYPCPDIHANEIIQGLAKHCPDDKFLFLYVNDLRYAELNMLMQHYKIYHEPNEKINMLCSDDCNTYNIVEWNPEYTHWSQMQTWELREWISLFYIDWTDEWFEAKNFVPDSWLKISTEELLTSPYDVFKKVCNYRSNFDEDKELELTEFSDLWKSKQQYIIDEFNLIDTIIDSTIRKKVFSWEPISIISESIIQCRLRKLGFGIKCYDLNIFPANALKLNSLLEKI